MVQHFMKDIEGQPDGDEDHPIISEDYAGHQGDVEFKDIERESLQGFGDADEMVENESNSVENNAEQHLKGKPSISGVKKAGGNCRA